MFKGCPDLLFVHLREQFPREAGIMTDALFEHGVGPCRCECHSVESRPVTEADARRLACAMCRGGG